MNLNSLGVAGLVFAAVAHGAPALEIQTAVEVKFDAANNRIYQLEAASPEAIDVWRPIAPAKWGRGKTVTNVVPTSVGPHVIFRTREYDLTNGLAYYLPLNGPPTFGDYPNVYVGGYSTSRFGTPKQAAVQVREDYFNTATATTIRNFAEGTNDFSISIWALSNDSPHVFGRVISNSSKDPIDPSPTNNFPMALIAPDTGRLELYFGGSAVPILVTQPLVWEHGRWYCFQLVRKANVFRIYRGVELVGEVSSVAANNKASLALFMGPETGSVDEVRFYNRALSPDELGVLFRLEED
jgi:hypothetical protein